MPDSNVFWYFLGAFIALVLGGALAIAMFPPARVMEPLPAVPTTAAQRARRR